MVMFAQGLGVQCTYCHAEIPGVDPEWELNFASDAKPTKLKARVMLRMVTDINGRYLAELGPDRKAALVVCGTCHMGHPIPEAFKPAPPPQ